MSTAENVERRHCIPVIYTRGTHYEVGFDIGRTFASMIQSFLEKCSVLNDYYIPRYETAHGRKNYDQTLQAVKENFPQYILELEGTALGAQVPFYKLFLFHLDEIIFAQSEDFVPVKNDAPAKDVAEVDNLSQRELPENCSTICLNEKYQQVIGHTEDALGLTLTHFYFVSAHIISDKAEGKWGVKEEKFTSLCYAGHLPGYTMSYNHHGLAFTTNTLCAKRLLPGKIPRHFIARAMLASENFEEAQKIMKDTGCGAADGLSFNIAFLKKETTRNAGETQFYNVEMSPAYENNESSLNILPINRGENTIHCNTYLRTKIEEISPEKLESPLERLKTLKSYSEPKTKDDVIHMLGDETGEKYTVFRDGKPDGRVKTIAVGIFDCIERTLSVYSDNPRRCKPTLVLPIFCQ